MLFSSATIHNFSPATPFFFSYMSIPPPGLFFFFANLFPPLPSWFGLFWPSPWYSMIETPCHRPFTCASWFCRHVISQMGRSPVRQTSYLFFFSAAGGGPFSPPFFDPRPRPPWGTEKFTAQSVGFFTVLNMLGTSRSPPPTERFRNRPRFPLFITPTPFLPQRPTVYFKFYPPSAQI